MTVMTVKMTYQMADTSLVPWLISFFFFFTSTAKGFQAILVFIENDIHSEVIDSLIPNFSIHGSF